MDGLFTTINKFVCDYFVYSHCCTELSIRHGQKKKQCSTNSTPVSSSVVIDGRPPTMRPTVRVGVWENGSAPKRNPCHRRVGNAATHGCS